MAVACVLRAVTRAHYRLSTVRLQRQIDKANYQATKLETKAFYQEQKRLSKPSVRTAEMRKEQEQELEAANKRLEAARTKLESAKEK